LLSLEPEDAEKVLSDMVTSGALYARIDRPAGVITFAAPKRAVDVLDEWGTDITAMLGHIETTCQLINRENMVHKITS
jgi:26S proteasome regulatory subunit N5